MIAAGNLHGVKMSELSLRGVEGTHKESAISDLWSKDLQQSLEYLYNHRGVMTPICDI